MKRYSRILDVTRFNGAGMREAGTVMTVIFELDGQRFVALNGGPRFTYKEAVSFMIPCETQEDADHWNALTADGGEPGDAAGSRISTAFPGRSYRIF